MTNRKINKIHGKLHPEVIATKGYNRNWPTKLRYAFHKYTGIGLLDYKVDQGVSKIQLIHKLLSHPKHSTLIQEITSWYQITAGTSKQVLVYPNTDMKNVNSIWFQDLIEIMSKYKIIIITEQFISLQMQQCNDKFIMDEVLRLNLFKQDKIKINACWLYLQITHISDITSADGKMIKVNFLTCPKSKSPFSVFRWPQQSNSSKGAGKM